MRLPLLLLSIALLSACGVDRLTFTEESVRDNPNPDTYLSRASARLDAGKLDGALDDCNAAIAGSVTTPYRVRKPGEAYALRGEVRERRGEIDAALADYATAASHGGSHGQIRRARLLLSLGRPVEAEDAAAMLLRSEMDSSEFRKGMALLAECHRAR